MLALIVAVAHNRVIGKDNTLIWHLPNDLKFFKEKTTGHVIIMDYNTTGDGQLTAIQLTKIMKETGKPLSVLADEVTIYPQKLVNIRVENSMKDKAMEVAAIAEIISKMEAEMAGNGRILVRPSGTEPLLRVMAEAPSHAEVDYYVETIADVVRAEIGME